MLLMSSGRKIRRIRTPWSFSGGRPFGAVAEVRVSGLRMSKAGAALLAVALAAAGSMTLCLELALAQEVRAQAAATPAAATQTATQAAASQAATQAAAAQATDPQPAQNAAAQANCPGHPDALGTSRVLALDPAEHPRIGRMQYPDSLALNDKEVVLTFDDGPLPPYSSQILDILAAQCVKATYFLIGEMARAFPAMVRRIYEEGHTIGTHSEDHPTRFGQLPVEKMRQEIDWGISDISAALGDPKYLAPFFRIPGLARSDLVESELAARGLIVFSSDTVADDWHHRIGAKGIIAAAMQRLEAHGKGILLLHDIHPKTVAALPGLLKELKDKGFHIVQVVPAASYVIAMANKPKARIASIMQDEPVVGSGIDRQAQPHWPEALTNAAPEDSALPVPDLAAFEPDAVPSEDVADVQWPVEAQVMTPPAAKPKVSRKHKSARSSEQRKQRVVHDGKQQPRADRAHKDRHERVRATAEGHRADNSLTSRVKAFSAMFAPAQAAAH
jgi:peptidoglycan/xylan/chitin deacetylase (PgdA/CDA1 family)